MSRSLNVLRVVNPCHENWEGMAPAAGKRFCHSCQKHVHDLSQLTRAEAEQLISGTESVCVRYTRDAAGQIVTRDTPPATPPPAHRTWLPTAAAAALALAGPGLVGGCDQPPPPSQTTQPPSEIWAGEAVMGDTIVGEIPAIPTTQPAPQASNLIDPAEPARPMVMGRIATPQEPGANEPD